MHKFRDLGTKLAMVQQHCKQINAYADLMEMKGKIAPRVETSKALLACQRKHIHYYGNTSKYKPHQGYQECARRRG